jgi:hypothetical protein
MKPKSQLLSLFVLSLTLKSINGRGGMLFLESNNSDWFNWVRLFYGGFAAAFSEVNNRYSAD